MYMVIYSPYGGTSNSVRNIIVFIKNWVIYMQYNSKHGKVVALLILVKSVSVFNEVLCLDKNGLYLFGQ